MMAVHEYALLRRSEELQDQIQVRILAFSLRQWFHGVSRISSITKENG